MQQACAGVVFLERSTVALPTSLLVIPTFDYNVLANFYTSGSALKIATQAEVLKRGLLGDLFRQREIGVIPPWELPPRAPAPEGQELQRIFSNRTIIDLTSALFERTDVDDNFKNLFALYGGLTLTKELVTYAKTLQADASRAILERQFQSYLDQVKDFVEDTRFTDVSLVYGLKKDTLASTVELPRKSNSVVYFGANASTVREDAIAGLTGTEKFTISVTENSVTKNVAVDLANVSGTLNLDNIVTEINAQLVAALVDTTFAVERFNEDAYGYRINVGTDETVSFSADASTESSAVYVAGSAGAGATGSGFLVKLDDLAAADPNETFHEVINTTGKADNARGVAVDSSGNVYVVGTTAGDLDGQINAGGNEVYLTKFDAAGNEIYSRLLGSSADANGFAVAVDSSDNVIIAGQVFAPLTDIAFGGGYDAFVTKFDSEGQETFTRQVSPFASDGALSLTVDSSDNIIFAGFTNGAIDSSQTYGGSGDAFVTKIDSSGTLVANQQFGDSGSEVATAIAVNAAGDIFVVGTDDGNGFLRRYNESDNSLAYTIDLGSLGTGGKVTGIAVDSNGDLLISGHSTNSTLSSTVKNAHSGGLDAFVLSIDDQTTTAVTDFVTYVGTSGTDSGFGIAVDTSDDSFYLTGNTDSTLSGEAKSADIDAFIAKFDSLGALAYTHQFGGAFDHTGYSIAFDSNGTSVLSRLGLPTGSAPGDSADTVIAETSVRPGQSFTISVDGGANERITVEDDDSFGFLAFRINSILGTSVPTLTLGSRPDGFECLLGAGGFFENGGGGCGPDEGNRVVIVDGEIVVDGLLQLGDAFEDAAPDAFSGDLGEEALDHVEPGGRCRGEMDVEARVFFQPPFDRRRLVGGVVVDDQVNVQIGQGLAVDPVEETNELLVAVALHAVADDLAIEQVERREQGGRAVALVVVGHGAGPALLHGQARLAAVECLDLALLVDRKDHRLVRRIEVEADHVLDFLRERRVVGDLEAVHQMRLEAVRAPDILDAGVADADRARHRAHAPMGRVRRRLAHRLGQPPAS